MDRPTSHSLVVLVVARQMLVGKGVPVNVVDRWGRLPLCVAAVIAKSLPVTRTLRGAGATVIPRGIYSTARGGSSNPSEASSSRDAVDTRQLSVRDDAELLCDAVRSLDLDRLRALLLAGCDVNGCGWDGRTLLRVASDVGDSVAHQVLIDAGAVVSKVEATPPTSSQI